MFPSLMFYEGLAIRLNHSFKYNIRSYNQPKNGQMYSQISDIAYANSNIAMAYITLYMTAPVKYTVTLVFLTSMFMTISSIKQTSFFFGF